MADNDTTTPNTPIGLFADRLPGQPLAQRVQFAPNEPKPAQRPAPARKPPLAQRADALPRRIAQPPATPLDARRSQAPLSSNDETALVPPTRSVRFRNWRAAKRAGLAAFGRRIGAGVRAGASWFVTYRKRILIITVAIAAALVCMVYGMGKIAYPTNQSPAAAHAAAGKKVAAANTISVPVDGADRMVFELPQSVRGIKSGQCPKWLKSTHTTACAAGEIGRKVVKGSGLIICNCPKALIIDETVTLTGSEGG